MSDTGNVRKPKGSKALETASADPAPLPAMPVIAALKQNKHREKVPDIDTAFRICVARPVGKREAETVPEALAAINKEWDKLDKQNAWLLDKVREWRDVQREA